jgi:hypothetical protein
MRAGKVFVGDSKIFTRISVIVPISQLSNLPHTATSKSKRMETRPMSHIEPHRLLELARMSDLTDQPDYEHLSNCEDCGMALLLLIAISERPLIPAA